MTKYKVGYWEKVSVWVRQDITIDTDVKPTKENLSELIDTCGVDYCSSDYSWETLEHDEYDVETDFEVEEN